MIRVLVDENLSYHFAKGLHALQFPLGDNIEVTSLEEAFGKRGVADEDWIPAWGKQSGIFLTQDIKITTRQQQAALFEQYKLGAFFLDSPKGYRYWDKVKMVIKHWQDMVEIMKTKKRPFAYLVTPRKISKL
jgi:hypothetical protein